MAMSAESEAMQVARQGLRGELDEIETQIAMAYRSPGGWLYERCRPKVASAHSDRGVALRRLRKVIDE